MINPQKENGYTAIANEILEYIVKLKLNGTQHRIIMVVWRYTYGFQRKEHELSETFIANAIGIKKRQVQRELTTLIDMNIITIVKEATFNSSRTIKFNKHYDKWCLDSEQVTNKTPPGEKDTHTGDKLDTQERNINTTIITINNENQNENLNQSFVADMDADSIQQLTDKADADSAINIVQLIENYYMANVVKRVTISQKDMKEILAACKTYPPDFIIKCIDDTCEKYKKQNDGVLNITSFKYFTPVLADEWNKEKLREAGHGVKPSMPRVEVGKGTQIEKNSFDQSYNRSRRVRNKFHNFEERQYEQSDTDIENYLRKRSMPAIQKDTDQKAEGG